MTTKKLHKLIFQIGLCCCLIILLLLTSCNQYHIQKNIDPFRDLYSSSNDNIYNDSDTKKLKTKYTFSSRGMSFSSFAQWFSDTTGFGVVFASSADNLDVSGEYKNTTAKEIINTVARRHNLEVIREGETFYIGLMKPDDRGILVRNVSGYSQKDLESSIKVLLGEHGKSQVFSNGVCVISDRESILAKINNMLDLLEAENENSWIIQLYFISIRKQKLRSQGVKVTPSAKLAYNILSDAESQIRYGAKVDAVLEATFDSNYANLRSAPMFLLRDGASAHWQDGEKVPIPQKAVSDYGTVTTVDYEYVNVGLLVDVSLREAFRGAILKLKIVDSRIVGYSELAPKLTATELQTELQIKSNGVFLIGELNTTQKKEGINKFLNFTDDSQNVILQVWVRCYRIMGDTKEDYNSYKKRIKIDNIVKDLFTI